MKNTTDFYNTTNETGQQLEMFTDKATKQEEAILYLFKTYKTMMTPSMVWQALNRPEWPLTSIRRGINNLTKQEKLQKRTNKKQGIFGRPEYYWSLI